MKIKVFILTEDKEYAEKLFKYLRQQYRDQVELVIFTQADRMVLEAQKMRPDLVLLGEEFWEEEIQLPPNSELVFLSERVEIETIQGKRAIGKYQKISAIYKELLDICSEKKSVGSITLKKSGKESQKILSFYSCAGGTGTSTAAAACARRLAEQGGSVLYLNLESFGAADVYFSGDGDFDFSRVIYALAMSNGTTLMKMESSVKKDPSGVFFYSGCANALDMLELDQEVLDSLFEEIESLTQFEWIIVDMDFALEEKVYRQLERSHANIFVSDGRETANTKLERCLNAIEILAAQRKTLPLKRMYILYNRFSGKGSEKLKGLGFQEIGGINRFENATAKELVQLIAQNSVFDGITNKIGW